MFKTIIIVIKSYKNQLSESKTQRVLLVKKQVKAFWFPSSNLMEQIDKTLLMLVTVVTLNEEKKVV